MWITQTCAVLLPGISAGVHCLSPGPAAEARRAETGMKSFRFMPGLCAMRKPREPGRRRQLRHMPCGALWAGPLSQARRGS